MRPRGLTRADAGEDAFVRHILEICEENGFRVITRPRENLRFKDVSGSLRGLFVEAEKAIYLATGDPEWFAALVHEFCHFQQYLEGRWRSRAEHKCWTDFEAWMHLEREFRPERIEHCVRTIQACEHDADRRVVKLAQKYKFPTVNVQKYIHESNRYVLCYEAARRTRTWYSVKRRPSTNPEMMAAISARGLIRNFSRLPPKFLELYISYCCNGKVRVDPR